VPLLSLQGGLLAVNWFDLNTAPKQASEGAPAPDWADQVRYSRDEVFSSLTARLESVLGYLYPAGFADKKGRKFYIGSIEGEEGESLSVELEGPKAGLWHDFATGEGGDIFDLWRAARGLSSFRETLKDAGEYTGAAINTPRRTPTRKNPKGGEAWGAATQTYNYTDTSGSIIAQVERFEWEKDGEPQKTFRPWDVASHSYKAPETRPLYNLPNIALAPEIIIVEGEKAADALIGQNIDATTAMGGSNAPIEKTDWSALRGRKVVIWPDNDTAGRAYAERLRPYLEGQGALAVSILNVPASRPEKWDAADAEGEDLGALIRSMRSDAHSIVARQSEFFKASDLADTLPPPRQWLIEGLIPDNQVTMLGGDGGVGKSLLALQLAVSTSTGTDWIGHRPKQGPVVYISAEDERDELHRRLADIVQSASLSLGALDQFHARSLAGEDALLAIADSRTGTLQPTDLLTELDQFIEAHRPRLVVLDTLADLHSGQENDRATARQFIGILRGLALRHSCTVLLLAHPSLTGISSGSGLSGSTAWNNSVRSRLFFERIMEDGQELDPDIRKMTTKKANYGRTGDETIVRWQDGVFVIDAAGNPADDLNSNSEARAVFMDMLDKYTGESRNVNANGGPNYAPALFAKDGRSGRFSRSALQQAMNDLFALGTIIQAPYGPPSKQATRIQRREQK
jgi:RecA-family ATPase/5S rRNA maturation endonuclease (ribonuclease M5)